MFKNKILFLTILLFSYLGVFHFNRQIVEHGKNNEFLPYPSEKIKFFTLGYQNAFASGLWLSFLTNSGLCDQNRDAQPSFNKAGSLGGILNNKLSPSRCNLGWGYHNLNLISELSPNFLAAYLKGGLLLSVAIDDRLGSKLIFDKGLIRFPGHSELNFRAAYHYLYEIQDPERAIELLQVAHATGGPSYIPSLIAALYKETGKLLLAKATLENFLANDPPEEAIPRAKERLEEINRRLKNE